MGWIVDIRCFHDRRSCRERTPLRTESSARPANDTLGRRVVKRLARRFSATSSSPGMPSSAMRPGLKVTDAHPPQPPQPPGVVEHLADDFPADLWVGCQFAFHERQVPAGIHHYDVGGPGCRLELPAGQGSGADSRDEFGVGGQDLLQGRLRHIPGDAGFAPAAVSLPDEDLRHGLRFTRLRLPASRSASKEVHGGPVLAAMHSAAEPGRPLRLRPIPGLRSAASPAASVPGG